eukprot:2980809-Prymnesium_polylepis.2
MTEAVVLCAVWSVVCERGAFCVFVCVVLSRAVYYHAAVRSDRKFPRSCLGFLLLQCGALAEKP